MKDTAIAFTFDRYPYAFAAKDMTDPQREAFAGKVQFHRGEYSGREATNLASQITGACVPVGAHR